MDWKNVTLKQFIQLQELMKIEDETLRTIEMAALLLGEDIASMPVVEFAKKVKELDFLSKEIPNVIPPKKLQVNGRNYYVDCLLGNITTAQYIDFTNLMKNGDLTKILSPFIIPEGHKYNDGYDMQQVFEDIGDLSIVNANSIAFFFGRQLQVFITTFQRYSTRTLNKMKITKAEKEKMTKVIRDLSDMVFYPLS